MSVMNFELISVKGKASVSGFIYLVCIGVDAVTMFIENYPFSLVLYCLYSFAIGQLTVCSWVYL